MRLADAVSIIAGIALLVWQMSRYHATLRQCAVLAERQRCAMVARDIAELGSIEGDTHVPTAEMIAAKIMEGGG